MDSLSWKQTLDDFVKYMDGATPVLRDDILDLVRTAWSLASSLGLADQIMAKEWEEAMEALRAFEGNCCRLPHTLLRAPPIPPTYPGQSLPDHIPRSTADGVPSSSNAGNDPDPQRNTEDEFGDWYFRIFPSELLQAPESDSPKVIALASTVLFRPKHGSGTLPQGGSTRSLPSSNIDSKAARWVDETTPSTIVVIEQPPGQTCAVIGGMMALRMKKLGAKGVVVSGRVRDMEELEETGLTIYAKGTSTVGTAAESEIHAIQVPIQVGDVEVRPGDIIFCDPVDGTVVIPQQLLPKVLEILPKLKEDDDNVKRAISEGMSVKEAFDRFRRKEF
ncbi:hypothetical protein MMC25_007063 [Agyrium rufum]|nr:hypothetical protein [Agyrium rufum]